MAVYKIFPEKDATLYSEYPNTNTGIDEIIEATTSTETDGGEPAVSRFLIKFNQSQILDVINSKATGSIASSLRVFVAKVEGLSQETTLYCYPVSGSWQNGTGKYLDSPAVENGVSWNFRTSSGSGAWLTSGFGSTGATASFSASNPGGGNWYTASLYAQSASYQYRSDLDINLNVTNTVLAWYSGSIQNDGFIVKQADSAEFSTDLTKRVQFKYFSVDTNTIYPPQLELKWNDFTYNTGSSTQTVVTDPDAVVTLPNNSGTYYPESIQRFRLNARPQFPPRVFLTSSFYTTNYYLPTASYWSVVDLDTNEVVIDFDSTYTKISADSTSNYFDLYMNGLEPERYYKILLKTIINGATRVLDEKYYFKVVNG
jgi:hypothetical protein